VILALAAAALAALLPATAGAARHANPQISGVSVNPATVAAGGAFDATAIFINHQRTATKKRRMLFRIFPAAGGGGSTLASLPIPALKPGSRVEISATLKLNPGKKPGDYDIVACRTPRKNKKRCGPNRASTPLTVVGSQLLTVEPTSHDFGTLATGDSTTARTFTFSNDGDAETGTLEVNVTGAAAQFTASSDTCSGTSLEPAQECTVDVAFTPTTVGARHAQLLLSGSPGGSASAQLSGSGAEPAALKITPTGKSFGIAGEHTISPAQAFTITNTGALDSGSLSTALAGADPGEFWKRTDGCDGVSLGSGQSCTMEVAFTPQSQGLKAATLNATAAPGGTVSADLDGTGVNPAHLTITPIGKSFGTIATGSSSAGQLFTVTNDGDVPTDALHTLVGGDNFSQFTKSSDGCDGVILGAGQSCTMTAAFTPTALGPKTATLEATGTPGGTAAADLDGTGAQPAHLTISPTSKAFADTVTGSNSSNQTFTVTNDGGVLSGSISVALSGSDTGQFSIQQDLCTGQTLLPTGNCTITARFSPISPGDKAASLDATASPGGTASSALSGTGLAPANLTVSPTSWDFGNVLPGTGSPTKLFTITNTGDQTSGPVSLFFNGGDSGDFTGVSDTCGGGTLAGGASCETGIQFTPEHRATSSRTTTFTATASSGPGGSASSTLTGTSVATAANLEISITDRTATAPGTYSSSAVATSNVLAPGRLTKKVWIRNSGEADAQIVNSPVPINYNESSSSLTNGATCNIETADDRDPTAITFTNLTIAGNSECFFRWFVGGSTAGQNWDASFTITGSPGGSISGFVSGS